MATFPTLEYSSGTYSASAYTPQELLVLLEDFTEDNVAYLLSHPEVAHPYQSGVRYRRERRGQERWQGIKKLLRRKRGDCEDLAAYLAAWYRARLGIKAKVVLKRFDKHGNVWYHAIVKLPSGRIVDPSKALGM